MIAGHAPIAFALAASLAAALGVERRRAVGIGILAGAFAVVPDVDMAYAVVGVLGSSAPGVWSATSAFWSHANVIHRAITHSLVLAVPAGAVFAALVGGRTLRPVGIVLAVALLVGALVSAGPLGAAMTGLYLLAGSVVALGGVRYGFGARSILAAGYVGLLSHPFGDLFTGTPPDFLYPLDVVLVPARVTLLPDPTLNLLAVFGLELGALWIAVLVAGHLLGVGLGERVHYPAAGGIGYGLAALVVPAPTLEVSYPFVFSVLAVGVVGLAPLSAGLDREGLSRAALTGLLAVTLGGIAYTAVYLLAPGLPA